MGVLHSSGLALDRAVDYFFVISGFFLYRRISRGTDSAGAMVKKVYLRLLPVTLFTLLILFVFERCRMWGVAFSIAQLNGLGLSKSIAMGRGDWFIGAYFWTSCLFIGLFHARSNYRWLWLGVLIYFSMMLRLRHTPTMESGLIFNHQLYFGLVSRGLVHAVSCMGMGMVSGLLAERVRCTPGISLRLVFTCLEIMCLVYIYKYMFDTKNCSLGYLEMTMVMGAFLISISRSWGYISQFFNRLSAVQYVSRYTLPTLFGHIICFHVLGRFQNFGWGEYPRAIFVIGGGIMLGVIEYHLVEKWLVPKIKVSFQS